MTPAVDKEDWSCGYTVALGFSDIKVEPGTRCVALYAGREALIVEPNLLCVAREVIILKVTLMGKERVMHLPKFTLILSADRGDRSLAGAWMHILLHVRITFGAEWEVTKGV